MQSETMTVPEEKPSIESGTSQLCDLAAAGLVPMFDPERRLFCYTYARTEAGMARQGISHRYTLMTLLGLRQYESSGTEIAHRQFSRFWTICFAIPAGLTPPAISGCCSGPARNWRPIACRKFTEM